MKKPSKDFVSEMSKMYPKGATITPKKPKATKPKKVVKTTPKRK